MIKGIAGAIAVIGTIGLLVSMPAVMLHAILTGVHRRWGWVAALLFLTLEAIVIWQLSLLYLTPFNEGLESGAIGGPAGFVGGMIGGFVVIAGGLLVLFNTMALLHHFWQRRR